MTTLSLIDNGTMIALGWTILHFCWQGAVIAIFYVIADRCTIRASAQIRYAIALTALVSMLLAAVATYFDQTRLVIHLTKDNGRSAAASQLGVFHEAVAKEIPLAAPVIEEGELFVAWNSGRLLPWVDGIWVCGVLLLALRAAGGWILLECIRRRATGIVPALLQQSFMRMQQQLCVGRNVALRISHEVVSPLAMGVWRTAIILPASILIQLAPDELESVLAHELAHIRRWDYLANLTQTVIESLLFFHPAVWWLGNRTRHMRETCCDAIAAQTCGDPVIFAQALLRLEEERSERTRLAAALNDGRTPLLERVSQILGEGIAMETGMKTGVQAAIAGAIVVGVMFAPTMAQGLKVQDQVVSVAHTKQQIPKALPIAVPVTKAAAVPDQVAGAEPAPMPMPAQAAYPTPAATVVSSAVAESAAVNANISVKHSIRMSFMQDAATKEGGLDYLKGMKDAGYSLDLDKDLNQIVALRSVGVTPEYAKQMAQVGLGTPSLHDLVALKSMGITPEYIASLKGSGIPPADFHEVLSEKSMDITPDYAKQIASIGLGTPSVHDLVSLKALGITPEYVAGLKASGINVQTLQELKSVKAVGVTPEYAKAIAASGFGDLNTHDLVGLKAQGVSPEYARWVKQTFPDADTKVLRRAAALHIDDAFIAKAKSHGFTSISLDKLIKLKTTGLLED